MTGVAGERTLGPVLGSDGRGRLVLRYVEDWSLGLDIVVLVRTMATVLRGARTRHTVAPFAA